MRTLAFVMRAISFALVWGTAPAWAGDRVDYSEQVYPILQKYCVSCHTADEAQGGLVMESFAALMKGGDSGPAVTAGAPGSSRMLLMASGKLEPIMPPDDAEGPSSEELEILAAWIEQGAHGPAGELAMRRELRTPSIKVADGVTFPITAIAISPDGSSRAIARYDGIEITADSNNTAPMRLAAQPGKVNSMRFSRDGKRLLVASGVTGLIGRATIYDLSSGQIIKEFEGHGDAMQIAVFSPDESIIATGSYDRQIILWNASTSEPVRSLSGHNGAIYSLAFSHDGKVLVSGSADATVKIWSVATGKRLDTMGQATNEVLAVTITPDDQFVVAGSADNRLRVWRLLSHDSPQINPLLVTRFVDETPLTHLAITPGGAGLVIVSEAGNVKLLRASDWSQAAVLEPLGETASDLVVNASGNTAMISLMSGETVSRSLPSIDKNDQPLAASRDGLAKEAEPVYLNLETPKKLEETAARKEQGLEDVTDNDRPLRLPRGAEFSGVIQQSGEEDWFTFRADAGEMWVIETDTAGLKSKLDSVLEILDQTNQPILQTRLQATRDSYFTFRGKNSTQNDDFRVFAWEEMKLDEYLYASGEVTRLWRYPRGSDSGFNVYPGRGNRWTYFGSSGTTHALSEPAYIVRPLAHGEPPAANGLPVFDIYYANDDHPMQNRGKDSYVLFKAPQSGDYKIRLRDSRGEGGSDYRYRMNLRPATPGFRPSVDSIKQPLPRGSGREITVAIDRLDGYDGEVIFEISDLPAGIESNFPVRIQPGQSFATGNIWAVENAADLKEEFEPMITAKANILGHQVERYAGSAGKLKVADRAKAKITIVADTSAEKPTGNGDQPITPIDTIRVRRGETISLMVKADRAEGFKSQIPLGNEQAGRNMAQGVYVDNIGLNGLLVREGESERQFFVTVDPVAELGKRDFFLTGAIEGGITSMPVTLEILP
jgi:hypothetical protein